MYIQRERSRTDTEEFCLDFWYRVLRLHRQLPFVKTCGQKNFLVSIHYAFSCGLERCSSKSFVSTRVSGVCTYTRNTYSDRHQAFKHLHLRSRSEVSIVFSPYFAFSKLRVEASQPKGADERCAFCSSFRPLCLSSRLLPLLTPWREKENETIHPPNTKVTSPQSKKIFFFFFPSARLNKHSLDRKISQQNLHSFAFSPHVCLSIYFSISTSPYVEMQPSLHMEKRGMHPTSRGPPLSI